MASRISITLIDESNWHDWFQLVQTIADSLNIWSYIDPTTIAVLTEPELPRGTPSTLQEKLYLRKLKKFDQQERDLKLFNSDIANSISPSKLVFLRQSLTPRAKLQVLKERFAPSSVREQQRWQQKYQELRTIQGDDVIDWLDQWQVAWPHFKEQKLPEIESQNKDYIRHFLETLYTRLPDFASKKLSEYSDKIFEDQIDSLPQIDRYISLARTYVQTIAPHETAAPIAPSAVTKAASHIGCGPCFFCALPHWHSECPYLFPPPGFTEDPAIRRRVNKQISDNSQWAQFQIERARHRRTRTAKQTSFAITHASYDDANDEYTEVFR